MKGSSFVFVLCAGELFMSPAYLLMITIAITLVWLQALQSVSLSWHVQVSLNAHISQHC